MTLNARTRWEYTGLALLTLLAAALRIYKLGEWSYFIDELRSWESTLASAGWQGSYLNLDNRRLFWLITRASLDIFGVNSISLRLFPFMVGILSIPLLYFPIKRLFDREVAFVTGLMIAISPWHIYMSQTARWYTFLILLMFFALVSFYRFIESNENKYLLFYVVLFYLGYGVHLTAAFVPVIAALYVFFLLVMPGFQNNEISPKRLWIILLTHIGLCLLLLPKLLKFVEGWRGYTESMGTWGSDFALKFVYQATPSVVFLALLGLALLLRRGDRRGLFLTLYCLVPLVALNVFLLLHMNVSARYLLFTLPAVLVAASYFFAYLKDQLQTNRYLLTTALIAVALLPSLQANYLYFTSEYGYRDRLREAMHFIDKQIAGSDNDQVFCAPTMFTAFDTEFYCKAIAQVEKINLVDRRLTAVVPDTLDAKKRTWLVTFGHVPSHPDGLWKWITMNAQLRAEFQAHRGTEDLTTMVYLYPPAGRIDPQPLTKRDERPLLATTRDDNRKPSDGNN
jgi:Dolichyl-phosphate-mannose-protein mannosyltransferase